MPEIEEFLILHPELAAKYYAWLPPYFFQGHTPSGNIAHVVVNNITMCDRTISPRYRVANEMPQETRICRQCDKILRRG